MNSLTVQSPAKVNLFLKILGRRRDGYHELVTLFHRISLHDTLRLSKIPDGIRISTNLQSVPADSRNLVWKAFDLLKREIPFKGGVSVSISKRIPVAGGLGGGSSNAAHFLLGLKRLYGLRISRTRLRVIGAKLGADVNFFLQNTNQALGMGKGEQLRALPRRGRFWFVVVAMAKPLSTATVYQTYRRVFRPRPFLTMKNQVATLTHSRWKTSSLRKLAPAMQNDLEAVSVRLQPAISKILRLFDAWNVKPHLVSGSGPTVFGMVESRRKAIVIQKRLRPHKRHYKEIFVAHTI